MQLAPLPKGIRDNLVEIERSLEKKIHGDTVCIIRSSGRLKAAKIEHGTQAYVVTFIWTFSSTTLMPRVM